MDSIIDKLYFGSIEPIERSFSKISEFEKYEEEEQKIIDELSARLCGEDKKRLDKLRSASANLESVVTRVTFADGFKLGARLMIAVFEEEDTE